MNKYNVTVWRQLEQVVTIKVTADNAKDAEDIAAEQALEIADNDWTDDVIHSYGTDFVKKL